MRQFFLYLLCIALFVGISITTIAQSDTQNDPLDDVVNAFEALYNNDSIRLENSAQIDSSFIFDDMTFVSSTHQILSGQMKWVEGELSAYIAHGGFETSVLLMGNRLENNVVLDTIFIDDTIYLKLEEVSGVPTIEPLIGKWVNHNSISSLYPELSYAEFNRLFSAFESPMPYLLTDESVITIDGVDIDPELALPEGAIGYYLQLDPNTALDIGDISFLDNARLGLEAEVVVEQLRQGTTIDFTVYIADGQIQHLMVNVITSATIQFKGSDVLLSQNSTFIYAYSDFNAPVTITAPETE